MMSIIADIFKGGKTLSYPFVAFLAFAFSMATHSFAAEARSITGVERISSSGKMSLNVTFEAGEPGDSHALYLAYAPLDMGTSIADWPVFQRVKIVGADETSATVIPQFIGDGNTVCRAFLVENAYPFDTPVEAIRQTGTQYIDTEIKPGPTTFASLDFKFDEAVKWQQRVFGVSAGSANFSFDAYINGAGYWASACMDGAGDFKASSLGAEASRLTVSLDAASGNLVIYNHVTHASTTANRSTTRTKTSVGSLYIFCQHNYESSEGAPVSFAAGGLIYGGVITTNSVPARSFQPCALGGRAGLYDAVSGRIFWSAVADDDFQIGGASVPFAPAESETQVAVSDAVSLATRAITDVNFSTADSVTTVNVTFDAGAAGDNHALYVAYAPTDMGAQLAGWTALQRVKIVGADETSATFTLLPQVTGAGNTVFRVFLVDSAYPFDRLVESIRQSNAKTQYIDTEFYPNPKTFAALDFKLDNASTVQQRLFGVSGDATANFAFDAYINGDKYWASACADGGGDFLRAAKTRATTDRYTVSLDANTGDHTIIKHSDHSKINKTRSTTRTKTSAGTLSILCQHKFYPSGTPTQENFAAGGLIYGGAIIDNGVPVRTYLPCALGSRAGLYDAVSGRIFWSAVANDDFTVEGASALCEPAAGETQVFASAPTGLFFDYTWRGTAENWGGTDAWTKEGDPATWVEGNNAIFVTANSAATLAADVSANSIAFSADATVAGTSDLSVKSVSVDSGVSATISAPISSPFEKTGAGVLTLTQDRTTATIVKEGTLKMDGATIADLTLGMDGGAPVTFDYSGQELVKNTRDYLVTGSTVTLTNGTFSTPSSDDLNIRDDTFTMPSVLTIAKDAVVRQGAIGKSVYIVKVNGTATINVIGGTLGNTNGCNLAYLQHKSPAGGLNLNVSEGGLVYFPCLVYALCHGDIAVASPSLYMTFANSAFSVGTKFEFGSSWSQDSYVPTAPTGVFTATNSVVSVGDGFIVGRNKRDSKTAGSLTVDFENCVVTAKTFAVYYDRQLNNARFNGTRFVCGAAGGSIVASDAESNWFTIGNDGLTIDTQAYSATLNANLGGSGTVTKVGAGTLTVSRNQATTGGFNVSAGALALNPGLTFAGSVSVADGAKLDINAANTVNVGSLAFAEGSSLNIASYIGTTPLAVSTDVTLPENGTVSLTLDGGAFGEGVYAIYSNSKVTEEDGAKFNFSAADNLVGEWSVVDNILILTVGEIDPNAWTGRGGDGKMSNGANWGGGIVPVAGSDIDFSGLTGDTAIIADAGRKFGAVTVGAGVITFTNNLTATSFSDMSKIAVAADSTVTIDSDIIITESSQRLCSNIAAGGKLRITGVLEVEQPSGNFQFSSSNAAGAVVVLGGIVMNTGSTSAGVLMNVKSLALGENGIAFTNNSPFRLISRPVVYALGERTVLGTNGRGLFRGNNAPFTFCTTQFESDQPATITLDARVTGVADYWAQWAVTGCGRFVTTAASGTNRGWTIEEGATFSLHPDFDTSSETSGQNYVVSSNATLEVGASGTLYVNGNTLTLADRASLGFNFTERATAPVFALGNKYTPTLTVGGAVAVKLSGVRPRAGEHVLTACGGFDAEGVTVSLAAGSPKWAKRVYVNADGNIVLDVKPRGTRVIVR